MTRRKPVVSGDTIEVIYTDERWKLLRGLRDKAVKIMVCLKDNGFDSIVHGSVARGDVNKDSDIDIFIPVVVPSYKVELVLSSAEYPIYSREIVQATPWHSIKAHIYIDEKTSVTFPLTELRENEWEFYKFSGCLNVEELLAGKRVPGVDKRLMLIIPTEYGHIEMPVVGRESEVADILGVDVKVVEERVKILLRRDAIGRTGVYLKREVPKDETFESYLKKLADRDPIIRRRIFEK